MSRQELNPNNNSIFGTERTARLLRDLEIAKLKQNNPLVSEQELQWRLGLLPAPEAKGQVQLEESIEYALREELRRARLLAERELEPLVDKLTFDIIAQLMIYGRSKSD